MPARSTNLPDHYPDDFDDRLRKARAGNRDALGHLLDAHRTELLGTAARQFPGGLRAKADPADLVQETLAAAAQGFANFRGASAGELRAWLFQILHNQRVTFVRHFCQGARRQVGREVPLPGADDATQPLLAEDDSPGTAAGRQESAALVRDAVAHLPADYRQVVELSQFEGLSFEEVARRLGRTEGAVRQLWSAARACLDRLGRERRLA